MNESKLLILSPIFSWHSHVAVIIARYSYALHDNTNRIAYAKTVRRLVHICTYIYVVCVVQEQHMYNAFSTSYVGKSLRERGDGECTRKFKYLADALVKYCSFETAFYAKLKPRFHDIDARRVVYFISVGTLVTNRDEIR